MAVSLTHLFVSPKEDNPADSTLVRPTNWNDEHKLTSGAGVVLGRPVGATPAVGPVEEMSLSAMFLPGMISLYGGTTAPSGWLLCNGASVSRTTYAALFAAISTNFGGSGTTFNVPNLQGRVPAGVGGSLLNNVTFSKRTVGGTGGTETFTQTTGTMPSHAHSHNFAVSDTGHGHQFRSDDGGTIVHTLHSSTSGFSQYSGTGSWLREAHLLDGKAAISFTGSINNHGSGTPHSITQPTMLITYIIKT